jgi:hypothetical protein
MFRENQHSMFHENLIWMLRAGGLLIRNSRIVLELSRNYTFEIRSLSKVYRTSLSWFLCLALSGGFLPTVSQGDRLRQPYDSADLSIIPLVSGWQRPKTILYPPLAKHVPKVSTPRPRKDSTRNHSPTEYYLSASSSPLSTQSDNPIQVPKGGLLQRRFQNSLPNFTMLKEDFPSHQNAGKCMEY